MMEFLREMRDERPEVRIAEGKRRRGFRPDQEIGRLSRGRRAQAEPLEFCHVGLVIGVPVACIFEVFREIRLDHARHMMRFRLRHKPRPNPRDQKKGGRYRGDYSPSPLGVFWRAGRIAPHQQRVEGCDQKTIRRKSR